MSCLTYKDDAKGTVGARHCEHFRIIQKLPLSEDAKMEMFDTLIVGCQNSNCHEFGDLPAGWISEIQHIKAQHQKNATSPGPLGNVVFCWD